MISRGSAEFLLWSWKISKDITNLAVEGFAFPAIPERWPQLTTVSVGASVTSDNIRESYFKLIKKLQNIETDLHNYDAIVTTKDLIYRYNVVYFMKV